MQTVTHAHISHSLFLSFFSLSLVHSLPNTQSLSVSLSLSIYIYICVCVCVYIHFYICANKTTGTL